MSSLHPNDGEHVGALAPESAPEVGLHEWECNVGCVSAHSSGRIDRVGVPGGWLYQIDDGVPVFVPDLAAQSPALTEAEVATLRDVADILQREACLPITAMAVRAIIDRLLSGGAR